MKLPRRCIIALCLLALPLGAWAGQPLQVPRDTPVYAAPAATVTGEGAVHFKAVLGVLVDARGDAVGLYRSDPAPSRKAMVETYGLGMLGTRAGVILSSDGPLPILVLHGHVGTGSGPYALSLVYLKNALTHSYGHCLLHLKRVRHSAWRFVNVRGQAVKTWVITSSETGIQSVVPCEHAARKSPIR